MSLHRNYDPYDPNQEKLIRELERMCDWLRQRLPRIFLIGQAMIVVLWLASGVYMVNPGHVGVVRTFGKETGRAGPGLHYAFRGPFNARI